MELSLEELQKELLIKKKEQEQTIKRLEETRKLQEMPFYIRIQAPENKKLLQRLEENQLWAMSQAWRTWNVPKEECDELGREFMVEFLAGEATSISDFLKKRNYKKIIID